MRYFVFCKEKYSISFQLFSTSLVYLNGHIIVAARIARNLVMYDGQNLLLPKSLNEI